MAGERRAASPARSRRRSAHAGSGIAHTGGRAGHPCSHIRRTHQRRPARRAGGGTQAGAAAGRRRGSGYGVVPVVRLGPHRNRARHPQPGHHHGTDLHRHGASRRAPGSGHQLRPVPVRSLRGAGHQPPQQWERRDGGDGGTHGRPRAVHQLAHRSFREPEPAGDLGSAAALERRGHQRRALAVRQPADLRERIEGEHSLAHALLERLACRLHLDRLALPVAAIGPAGGVMAKYRVQPPAEVLHLAVALQRGERAQEGLLYDILGTPVGAQPAGKPRQLTPVALNDGSERLLVAIARQPHKPLVRLRAQE